MVWWLCTNGSKLCAGILRGNIIWVCQTWFHVALIIYIANEQQAQWMDGPRERSEVLTQNYFNIFPEETFALNRCRPLKGLSTKCTQISFLVHHKNIVNNTHINYKHNWWSTTSFCKRCIQCRVNQMWNQSTLWHSPGLDVPYERQCNTGMSKHDVK